MTEKSAAAMAVNGKPRIKTREASEPIKGAISKVDAESRAQALAIVLMMVIFIGWMGWD